MIFNSTSGIVLHSSHFGEADCLSVILTRNSGKQKFLFKGLRKSRRRSQTSTEPGSVIQVSYYEKNYKDYIIAREFSLETYYPALRNSLVHLYSMFYMLELTEKTTGFNHSELQLYTILSRALETLSNSPHPQLLLLQFQLQLMKFQGILPELNRCSTCGSPVSGFHVTIDLTVLCAQCNAKETFYFTPEHQSIVSTCLSTQHNEIDSLNIDPEDLIFINFHLSLILEDYHSIMLKSRHILFEKFQINT